MNVNEIQRMLQRVADERDWNQFHTPKNLSMALSVETSELLEIFQWLTSEESLAITDPSRRLKIEEEIGDIGIYLIRICHILKVDLEQAILNKMDKNLKKYPVEKSKGNAKKYTEF